MMKVIAILLAIFLVGLCTATPTQRDVGSSAVCQDCQTFGKDIQDVLHSKTEDQLKQIVLNICQQFTTQTEICNEIVLSYFDIVYDYLMNQFDPDQICKLLGFCDQTNNKPELQFKMIQSLVKLIKEKRLADDTECELCQTVVKQLKDMILTDTTKEEVKQALLAVCSHLGSFAQQCTNAVNNYLDIVFNILVIELDPKMICTALHLCDGDSGLSKFLPMAKLAATTY